MASVTGIIGPTMLVAGAVLLLGPELKIVRHLLRQIDPAARTVEVELASIETGETWDAVPATRAILAEMAAEGAPRPEASATLDEGTLIADGNAVEAPDGTPITAEDVRGRVNQRYQRRLYGLGVAAMGLGIFLQWWGYVATA
jgi:hypothetical protein